MFRPVWRQRSAADTVRGLQVPAKKLVNGHDYAKLNLSSAEDPECLKVFVDHPELRLVDVPEKSKL